VERAARSATTSSITQKTDLETAIRPAGAGDRPYQQDQSPALPARSTISSTASSKSCSRAASSAVNAHLKLTSNEDILEAGIEIFAQPPGKKNQTVELLSGGEKAMTAVALIFAIFLIKPSPFCLLDEVDAPLDEANVGRFNDLVRSMTDRSQFILITHNKRTMQIADTLVRRHDGRARRLQGRLGEPPRGRSFASEAPRCLNHSSAAQTRDPARPKPLSAAATRDPAAPKPLSAAQTGDPAARARSFQVERPDRARSERMV
jgi:ATPase subunit of ABC transporter with duplicated ATPase domains